MKTHKQKVSDFLNKTAKYCNWYGMPTSTYGVWQIFGEDTNCDFGGSHSQPLLDTVEGELEDVISYAVELPNFWSWGSGGDIRKVEVKKIDKNSAELRKQKQAELEVLKTQVAMLESELK